VPERELSGTLRSGSNGNSVKLNDVVEIYLLSITALTLRPVETVAPPSSGGGGSRTPVLNGLLRHLTKSVTMPGGAKPNTRIELATSFLPRMRSPTELIGH
jgi:hypothetical protein